MQRQGVGDYAGSNPAGTNQLTQYTVDSDTENTGFSAACRRTATTTCGRSTDTRGAQCFRCKMSEKRRPEIKIVAEVSGTRNRVELFPATLWPGKFHVSESGRYRVRINGKWAHGDDVFTVTEVMRQLRGWIASRAKRLP